MVSQEYLSAIVLLVGALLKIVGIGIDNKVLEGFIAGGLALWIAVRRYQKGDIALSGVRK